MRIAYIAILYKVERHSSAFDSAHLNEAAALSSIHAIFEEAACLLVFQCRSIHFGEVQCRSHKAIESLEV